MRTARTGLQSVQSLLVEGRDGKNYTGGAVRLWRTAEVARIKRETGWSNRRIAKAMGISEQVADILENLSAGQILKIAK